MRARLRIVASLAVAGLMLFCAAALFAAQYFQPQTTTITVTNTNDSGPGSLRQALIDVPDGGTIQFDAGLNGQTITLTTAELVVSNSVTISGPGPALLTVSRGQQAPKFRIFHILPNHTVAISGLTISGGSLENADGAGIFNEHATLTLSNCSISGNNVNSPASPGTGGGGISNNGTLTIISSSVSNNGAFGTWTAGGGGIGNGGTMEILHSSIIGNSTAFSFGGGIAGSYQTITNCTISGNTGFRGGGIAGGGNITHTTFSDNSAFEGGSIYAFINSVQLANNIFRASSSSTSLFSGGSSIFSFGYNLSSDNGGGFLTNNDQINTNPMLGPLQNNGGPTSTQALLLGSPAIDMGDPNFTPPPQFDQRGNGYPRVLNGRIDIGSFEAPLGSATTPTPTPTQTPCLPMLTQSTSQAVTTANSASCNDGNTHTDNSYWRAFDMATYANGGPYCINSVSFGVEFANTTQPVTIRLYTTSNFPTGFPFSLTEIATTTVNVSSSQNGTVVTTPLAVTVPAGTPQLIMELFTPNGQPGGYRFFVGSNAAMETAPSYFSAPACGITTPTTTAIAGFPNMHIVFDINGSCTCGAPSPTPCPLFNISGTAGQCTTAGPSGVALPGVTMTISPGGTSVLTDNSGFYNISGFSCVTNTVTPTKAARPAGSQGIDTVDVLSVQRHFLGLGTPLTGCRLTAADCAAPVGITTGDVIAIQRYFLIFTTGIGSVGQYRFTPPNRVYPPPINNQTGQNYDAIVFGDVSAPYATP